MPLKILTVPFSESDSNTNSVQRNVYDTLKTKTLTVSTHFSV